MKGDAKVIDTLNELLARELTVVNQYMVHAEMCENWGFAKLAAFTKKQSIDEMKHAEALIERILFLDGIPNMTKYRKLHIGATISEMIQNDLNLELEAVTMYNDYIAVAVSAKDNGTAELLKKLLKDEEGHVDGLEEQLDLIKAMGLSSYLIVQTGK